MNTNQMIPNKFLELARSSEIYTASEKIGELFGLHIDQVGELDAEIRDILCGVAKSSNFTSDIMKRLDIDRELAQKIMVEVNKEVFDTIKDKLMAENKDGSATQTTNANDFGNKTKENLEKMGNFSLEQHTEDSISDENNIENKDRLVDGIENPVPGYEKIYKNNSSSNTEPLIDHLLTTPIIQKEKKVEIVTNKKQDPDPYREIV
jgi:hypothetical protein